MITFTLLVHEFQLRYTETRLLMRFFTFRTPIFEKNLLRWFISTRNLGKLATITYTRSAFLLPYYPAQRRGSTLFHFIHVMYRMFLAIRTKNPHFLRHLHFSISPSLLTSFLPSNLTATPLLHSISALVFGSIITSSFLTL